MKRHILILAALAAVGGSAYGASLRCVQFRIVDPLTGAPVSGTVTLSQPDGRTVTLRSNAAGVTPAVDTLSMDAPVRPGDPPKILTLAAGTDITLHQDGQLPTKEIDIHVTVKRNARQQPAVGSTGTVRDNGELKKFGGASGGGNDTKQLTKGQAGVAEDSAGQAHVRGEHSEIAFVVDGVPLPDTLSGRQGSIVVPSTIQSLEMITGGFAPEFGGQTAAVLNIKTLARHVPRLDLTSTTGSFGAGSGEMTAVGAIGPRGSYVVDWSGSRTDAVEEPQQPDRQDAHNAGANEGLFGKFRVAPNSQDSYTMTLSRNPSNSQVGNRTGLPGSFAPAGQGYGFLGLRNADGTRPDAGPGDSRLGASPINLASQQDAGMDIDQDEITEFGVLNFVHEYGKTASTQLALTVLHSGQDTWNRNPAINLFNLPVDNSIEFNPVSSRNVHQIQLTGNYDAESGGHEFKLGFLIDAQSGNESYQVVPASQLALDALAAAAPVLAPKTTATGATDINGNPVVTAAGPSPTVNVHREGAYKAVYAQDTWKAGKFAANYGLRADWYNMNQDLGQPDVQFFELSPRANLEYRTDALTTFHASVDHLVNTPPLAQGAVVGQAIQPEVLNQYDLAVTHKLAANQQLSLAYYYKDIRNQVDTGLLIPGSQIGLYSAVNFEFGGVHGLEIGYDVSAPGGIGWDGYLNYSRSKAAPNGLDNTGAPVPDFNDHDQTDTLGIGLAYTWKSGYSVAGTFQYGSGLASSPVPPSTSRIARSQLDLHFSTGDRLFHGQGGLSFDITNVFDHRDVINFQSGFSGTRFQQGRMFTLSVFAHV